MKRYHPSLGLSLVEVTIVVALIAFLGSVSFFYGDRASREARVESAGEILAQNLKEARARAVVAESSLTWGVRLVNSTADYYEVFSTPTNYADPGRVTDRTIYLTAPITFSTPAEGITTDIIFTKYLGTASGGTAAITTQGISKTITVTAQGLVY